MTRLKFSLHLKVQNQLHSLIRAMNLENTKGARHLGSTVK